MTTLRFWYLSLALPVIYQLTGLLLLISFWRFSPSAFSHGLMFGAGLVALPSVLTTLLLLPVSARFSSATLGFSSMLLRMVFTLLALCLAFLQLQTTDRLFWCSFIFGVTGMTLLHILAIWIGNLRYAKDTSCI